MLTQAAVLQLLVEQLLTHHAVLQPVTAVATAAQLTHLAVHQPLAAMAAQLTQAAVLQLLVATAAETAVAKAAATMTAAKLRS